MLRLSNVSSNGVIQSELITSMNTDVLSIAKTKHQEYYSTKVALSEFSEDIWKMTDNRENYFFRFNQSETELILLCDKCNYPYEQLIIKLKAYIDLLIGRCSLAFLREFIGFTLRHIITSKFFVNEEKNTLGNNVSMISYYREFVSLISPSSLNYLEFLQGETLRATLSRKQTKKFEDHPCVLSEFQSYFLFDELLFDYWCNASDNAKNYYFPLVLFWKLTTILPLRVMEFCVIPFDCIKIQDEKYFLTIRRTKLKGSNGSHIVLKHRYSINKDFDTYTYQINRDLFDLFAGYKELSINYHRNYDLLFSLDFMQAFNTSSHKKDYNKESIFDVEALNKLLNDFYNEILIKNYKLSIVDESDLMERYCNSSNSYELAPGEIMKIKAKHTRHLAMINLVYNGCSPMAVKEFADHASEATSAHYYGNGSKTVRCITKILYDKGKKNNLNTLAIRPIIRSSLSLFVDESDRYIALDDGKCYSKQFLNDDYSDCIKCGYSCIDCQYYIPEHNDGLSIDDERIDEEMRLLSIILRREDITEKLEEYQHQYSMIQKNLAKYINNIWRKLENGQTI